MNDVEFLKHFEAGDLHGLPHKDHLRMAWLYLRADGFEGGSEKICAGLRRFTAAQGAAGKYHETITLFWARLVAYAMALTPEIDDFEGLIAAHDHLLDRGLLKAHYSAGLLRESREIWAAPDLKPLPGMEAEHEAG